MKTRREPLTHDERQEVWRRWRMGESMADIARALDGRFSASVHFVLASSGGILSPELRRSARSLSLLQREEISSRTIRRQLDPKHCGQRWVRALDGVP